MHVVAGIGFCLFALLPLAVQAQRSVDFEIPNAELKGFLPAAVLAAAGVHDVSNSTAAGALQGWREQRALAERTGESYLSSIEELESSFGAYSDGLSEKLQGLALAYYDQGRNEEAIPVFSRALHLSRINNGLYHTEQVPILRKMIDNYIQLGDYDTADDRQYYLYRVMARNYGADDPRYLEALNQYAEWQREAYLAEVGRFLYRRLLLIYDLRMQVLELSELKFGATDAQLLGPLRELMKTQYLIAAYNPEIERDDVGGGDYNRFQMLRLGCYRNGKRVLERMQEIHQANPELMDNKQLNISLAMGDWSQWFGRRQEAMDYYQQSYQQLQQIDSGGDLLQAVFGQPVALPVFEPFSGRLAKANVQKGYLTAEFDVSAEGRARGIKLLEATPDHPRARRKVRESIKMTRFRPRFEQGEPVATTALVRQYEFNY